MSITFNTRAIILRRANWRENDKKVVFYSADFGKIEALAIGAAKITSKLAGHLEPGREVDLLLAKGKNIAKVGQAVTRINYWLGAKDFESYWYGSQCLALFDSLLKPGAPDKKLFFFLQSFLQLAQRGVQPNKWPQVGCAFSLKLLSLLGYEPRLDNDQTLPLSILKISRYSLIQPLEQMTRLIIEAPTLLGWQQFTANLVKAIYE